MDGLYWQSLCNSPETLCSSSGSDPAILGDYPLVSNQQPPEAAPAGSHGSSVIGNDPPHELQCFHNGVLIHAGFCPHLKDGGDNVFQVVRGGLLQVVADLDSSFHL